ncbi:MAG: 2-phospho-L-lactate guanylyltransferase [Chloroflexi bacterium]|nr:2-phospho-L-lactate guanylyltransferase [Chloroflexota bacterium]PWB68009.1 MAG: 2-phospho-L-lactate guanylyltransferase [Holophagae bacterium]
MTGLPVLIPAKGLGKAKGRLAGVLSAEERKSLALITLETVLRAAGPRAVVLTPDERVAAHVGGRGRVLLEVAGAGGLNPQLDLAVATLMADGTVTTRLLILHADLPLATAGAIQTLDDLGTGANTAVLVESGDGGTNAMLLSPPGRFALAYGPGSFAKHRAAAEAAGMVVVTNQNRELTLDLDKPDDLRELLRTPRGRQGAAGRYLQTIGMDERLRPRA